MYLIPVFLFSLSANIDSFIIGISYGIKKTKIRPAQNLLIALVTLCGTAAALLSGTGILTFCSFPGSVYLGNFILLVLGLYYLGKFFCSCFRNYTQKTCRQDADSEEMCKQNIHSQDTGSNWTYAQNICTQHTGGDGTYEKKIPSHDADDESAALSVLSWKEALLLGLSLSVNNLGIGIGASIAGLKVFPTAPVSFLLSMLFLSLGNLTGRSRIFEKAGQYADLFCGLLLVTLGFCQ